jgi:hypothetical protein
VLPALSLGRIARAYVAGWGNRRARCFAACGADDSLAIVELKQSGGVELLVETIESSRQDLRITRITAKDCERLCIG